MVLQNKQFQYDSHIIQINNANKEQLNPFIEEYLNDHSYFKSKDIALKYLLDKYQFTFYDLSNELAIIQNLTRKIGKLLKPYKTSGAIKKFNSNTYQVIK